MAKLSISEAIKQSGVARSTFYNKYVNKGIISVSVSDNKKYIDSSELVRVFPNLAISTTKNSPSNTESNSVEHPENTLLKMEIKLLREVLDKTEEDKQWLKDQNATLLLRLEPPQPQKHINPLLKWWRGLGDK
jgi:hypothetical protein